MYVYYEITKDFVDGQVLLTQIVLSSSGVSTDIHWKHKAEKQRFELISSLLKSVSLSGRTYDAETKIWSFFEDAGSHVIKAISTAINSKLVTDTHLEEHFNLEYAVKTSTLHITKKPKKQEIKFKEEEFFYSSPSLGSGLPTGDELYSQLASLLQIGVEQFRSATPAELKRSYRTAALRLHPDRNGGDSTKMSELNMLWAHYNSVAQEREDKVVNIENEVSSEECKNLLTVKHDLLSKDKEVISDEIIDLFKKRGLSRLEGVYYLAGLLQANLLFKDKDTEMILAFIALDALQALVNIDIAIASKKSN